MNAQVPGPVSGIFGDGMAYLRMGTGPKTLLWIPGGPGNVLPTSGLSLRMGQVLVPAVRRAGLHGLVGHPQAEHAHRALLRRHGR